MLALLLAALLPPLRAASLELNVSRQDQALQLGPHPIIEYQLSGDRGLFEVSSAQQACCTVTQPRLVPSYMLEFGPAADFCLDDKCLDANRKTLYLDNCTLLVSKLSGSDKLEFVLLKEDPQDYWRHFISVSGWSDVSMAEIEVRLASDFGSVGSGEFRVMILRKTRLINPVFISFNHDWTESKGSALNHGVEGEWIMRYHDGQFIVLLNGRQLYVLENRQLLLDYKPVVEFDKKFGQFEVCRLGSVLLVDADKAGLYFMNSMFELELLSPALTDIVLLDTAHGHFMVTGKDASGQPVEHYIREHRGGRPELVRLQRESSTSPLVALELAAYFVFGYDNTTEILYKDSHFGSISSAKRMDVEVFVAVIHNYRSAFQNIVGLIVPKKDPPTTKPILFVRQFNLLSGWLYCVPGDKTENLTEAVSTRVHIKTLKFPLGVTVNFLPSGSEPRKPEDVQRQSDGLGRFRAALYTLAASLLAVLLILLAVYKCYVAKRLKEVVRVQEMIFNVAPPDADAEQGIKGTLGFEKTRTARPTGRVSDRPTRPTYSANEAQPGSDAVQGAQEVSYAEEFAVEDSADAPDPDDRKEDLEDFTHPSVRKRGTY